MGKFKACVIAFKNKKEVFREGEMVSGALILEVLEPLTVKAVRVYCCGEALTKWSREFSRDWSSDNIGSEKYYNQCYTVFGKKLNVDGPNVQLTAGKHVWGFAFKLPPTSLPSSYEGEYGAIRWWLRAEVDKPFPAINNKWYRSFTVLSKLDLNEPVYAAPQSKTGHKIVSKALGIGNAGSVSLSVKTDRKSNNNFPNFPITPMCPYVDNYVYNPTAVAAATGATPYPPPQAKPEADATV
nr:hypothetical protein BaRGS_029717 [Batillaria attramentaria]